MKLVAGIILVYISASEMNMQHHTRRIDVARKGKVSECKSQFLTIGKFLLLKERAEGASTIVHSIPGCSRFSSSMPLDIELD